MGFSLSDAALGILGGAATEYNKDVEETRAADRAADLEKKRLASAREAFKWQADFTASHKKKTKHQGFDEIAARFGGYGTAEGQFAVAYSRGDYTNDGAGHARFMRDYKSGKVLYKAYMEPALPGQPTATQVVNGEVDFAPRMISKVQQSAAKSAKARKNNPSPGFRPSDEVLAAQAQHKHAATSTSIVQGVPQDAPTVNQPAAAAGKTGGVELDKNGEEIFFKDVDVKTPVEYDNWGKKTGGGIVADAKYRIDKDTNRKYRIMGKGKLDRWVGYGDEDPSKKGSIFEQNMAALDGWREELVAAKASGDPDRIRNAQFKVTAGEAKVGPKAEDAIKDSKKVIAVKDWAASLRKLRTASFEGVTGTEMDILKQAEASLRGEISVENKGTAALEAYNESVAASDNVMDLIEAKAPREEILAAMEQRDFLVSITENLSNDTNIERLNAAYNKAERKYDTAIAAGEIERAEEHKRDAVNIRRSIAKAHAANTEVGAGIENRYNITSAKYQEDLRKTDARMKSIFRFESIVKNVSRTVPGAIASFFGGVKRNFTGLAAGMNWDGYDSLTLEQKKAEIAFRGNFSDEEIGGLARDFEKASAASLQLAYLLIGMYKELGLSRTNNQQITDIKSMLSSSGSSTALQDRLDEMRDTITHGAVGKIEYLYTGGEPSEKQLDAMADRGVMWLQIERKYTADLSTKGIAFIRDNAKKGKYMTKEIGDPADVYGYRAPKVRNFREVIKTQQLTRPLKYYNQ